MRYGSSFLSCDEFPKDFKGQSLIITKKFFSHFVDDNYKTLSKSFRISEDKPKS